MSMCGTQQTVPVLAPISLSYLQVVSSEQVTHLYSPHVSSLEHFNLLGSLQIL